MKRIFFILYSFIITSSLMADEGMWIPMLLQKNQSDMQRLGMKITTDDIYQINQASLKDAIVLFDGGCTGEYVSDQGLILTNHHCGYDQIVQRSSLENNYLTNGFWATSKAEELPCPGLTVISLVRMEDVTEKVLKGVTEKLSLTDREKKIQENIDHIKRDVLKGTHYSADIKPFYYGNQYFLYINEIFEDVRLVGTPPSNIGKFGGDTDNWMWPRHTGDFSIFRVYANSQNQPAKYNPNNVPFHPKKHLTISLKGIEENDFTFVFGYPGRTFQFLTSTAVDLIGNTYNPARIALRDKRLNIFNAAMESSEAQRLRYAIEVAYIANRWKKMIGESKGINRLHAIEKKKETEKIFMNWVLQNPVRKSKYESLFTQFDALYAQISVFEMADLYFSEAFLASDLIRFARQITLLENDAKNTSLTDSIITKKVNTLEKTFSEFFAKDQQSHIPIDKQIFIETLRLYREQVKKEDQPEVLSAIDKEYQGSIDLFADHLYKNSFLISGEKTLSFIRKYKRNQAQTEDPALTFYKGIASYMDTHFNKTSLKALNDSLNQLYRIYVKAQMEREPDRLFFPDANLTLRVAYGKIAGYTPADGIDYRFYSTIEGIMQKENPKIYDYVVEPKLKELYLKKDYGAYKNAKGELPVAFIATNHTTGGNSGSPVLNAKGELIGLNFDRCWEGTMSDIMFDPDQCRNITLDIRYCLFIIDKFANASGIIEEMTITK